MHHFPGGQPKGTSIDMVPRCNRHFTPLLTICKALDGADEAARATLHTMARLLIEYDPTALDVADKKGWTPYASASHGRAVARARQHGADTLLFSLRSWVATVIGVRAAARTSRRSIP